MLLLDDEEVFLEIASMKLREGGFAVEVSHTVTEALAKAEELLPDLILSDIYMPPGPNGWELALAVRRDPKLKDIKFAFFTSLRDPAMELAQADRARIMNELRGVVFFNKTDIAGLSAGISEIIKSTPH